MPIVMNFKELYTDNDKRFTGINPTGYRYKVFSPKIRPLWDLYCKKQGIPKHFPASDKQRADFEKIIDELIRIGKITVIADK